MLDVSDRPYLSLLGLYQLSYLSHPPKDGTPWKQRLLGVVTRDVRNTWGKKKMVFAIYLLSGFGEVN